VGFCISDIRDGGSHSKGEAKSRGMGFSLVGGSVLREVLVFSDLRR
jgi:hypothetical protein